MGGYKKSLRHFKKSHMRADEQVLQACDGYVGEMMGDGDDKQVNGCLLVTNQRLVFVSKSMFSSAFEQMQLDRISSVDRRSNMLGHHRVNIYGSGNALNFATFDKFALERLLTALDRARHSTPPSAGPSHQQVTDDKSDAEELERLWELHEAGALSRKEFDQQKSALLAKQSSQQPDQPQQQPDQRQQQPRQRQKQPKQSRPADQLPQSKKRENNQRPPRSGVDSSSSSQFTFDSKYPTWVKIAPFGLIGLLLLFSAVANDSSQSSDSQTEESESGGPAPQPDSNEQADSPEPKSVTTGEVVQFRDWTVEFSDPATSDQNGDDQPDSGNIFLTVSYELTNNANWSRKDPMEHLVIRSAGKEHPNRNQTGESTFRSTLRSNQSQTQWQTFELPKDVLETPFTLEFVDGDEPAFIVELEPDDVRTEP